MPDLDYARVTGRFGITAADGPVDLDDEPDTIWCDAGEVHIRPLTTYVAVAGASPVPTTLGNSVIVATIDSNGYLTYNGKPSVYVVDLTSPKVNPQIADGKATHEIRFVGVAADGTEVKFETRNVRITKAGTGDPDVNGYGRNDITLLSPVASAPSQPIYRGETGTGIETLEVDGANLKVTLTDGTEIDAGELPAGPGGSNPGVAAYIGATGPTKTALTTAIASQIEPVQDQLVEVADTTPTIEDVGSITVPLAQGATTISAATTIPLHVAQAGETVEQLSLVVSAAVAASDSSYWTARLVRYRGGVGPSTIATKTTKTVASGGEGMVAFGDWNLDAAFWAATRQLAKGDVLALMLIPTGSPTALTLPSATFRVQPDDGTALALVDVVWDTFTRADSTSALGTATSGHPWTVQVGGVVMGIDANRAYRVDATAPRGYVTVDSGFDDARVSLDLVVTGATLPGPCFRLSTSGGISCFTTDASNLYRANADGSLTSIATFTAAVQGNNLAIRGSGTSIWVEKNGVQVTAPVTDTLNQDSTLHGFRISTGSGSYRVDNFKVAA